MTPSLVERLRQRISREGPISFRDFMEAALYDAAEGYYARGAPIGEPGDFVTSPCVSPAFAAALAREFRRETGRFEGPVDFVDAGSGDGRFLADFAAALGRQDPAFAARVRLTAVERSARAREDLSRRGLSGPARLLDSAERLREASVRGWIFSNELFDALPVVRVEGSAEGLRELRVGLEAGRFVWTPSPAPPPLRDHLASFGVALAPGQAGEIAPGAAPLYRHLARALALGCLVTFDYGHRAPVLYHPLARSKGTLAVHSAGKRGGDPLERPGEVDLTAHVNWDDLARAGEAEGLATRGVFRQASYLARAGLFDFVGNDAEKWRAYRLVDPEGMGEELSVLIQTRGIG
ncbi:MAG: class I SAM-dependent methyltransferase [Thermoanaerobaculia bacterium]